MHHHAAVAGADGSARERVGGGGDCVCERGAGGVCGGGRGGTGGGTGDGDRGGEYFSGEVAGGGFEVSP